jgi:hypothetical protein
MREPSGRRFESQGDDSGGLSFGDAGRSSRSGLILKTGDPRFRKPTTDSTYLHGGIADVASDLGAWDVIRHQQHRPRTTNQPGGRTRRPLQAFQCPPISVRQGNRAREIGHVAPVGLMWP